MRHRWAGAALCLVQRGSRVWHMRIQGPKMIKHMHVYFPEGCASILHMRSRLTVACWRSHAALRVRGRSLYRI